MKVQQSFAKVIFYKTALITIVLLSCTTLVSLSLIRRTLSHAFQENHRSIQNLFTNTIAQDLLIGSYSEVYKKCLSLFENKAIQSIQVKAVSGDVICRMNRPDDHSGSVVVMTPLYFDDQRKEEAGNVRVEYSEHAMDRISNQTMGILLIAVLIAVLLSLIVVRSSSHRLTRSVRALAGELATGKLENLQDLSKIANGNSINEVAILLNGTEEMAKKLVKSQNDLISRRAQEIETAIAKQVAHDIRSPLSALAVLLKCVPDLPDEVRSIVKHSVGRISDIATQLLAQGRHAETQEAECLATATVVPRNKLNEPELLAHLVERIVAEKKFQMSGEGTQIAIDSTQIIDAYDAFVAVDTVEMSRVVSNLINNAIESMESSGKITLTITRSESEVVLSIGDTGKGIPADVVSKIGNAGATFGKANGNGLGLYHARTTIEGYGGKFLISTVFGSGTTITIVLPRVDAPVWHVSQIDLYRNTTVAVLDDDCGIHKAWQLRFCAEVSHAKGIDLVTFTQPSDFKNWHRECSRQEPLATYLVDYDLVGSQQTGLDIIAELDIGHRAILVTSDYDDRAIRKLCADLGVGLVPKWLIGQIPIKVVA